MKKEAHPLTLLPASKMVLDEWKRTYSNYRSEPFSGVMAKFDEQFDASGYTLFKAVYQYPEECTVGFMVSNLLNGMLQRCDDVRKFAFGAFQVRFICLPLSSAFFFDLYFLFLILFPAVATS